MQRYIARLLLIDRSGKQPRGRGGTADTTDLNNLSARGETREVELLKFGETCNGDPEPNPDGARELGSPRMPTGKV